MCGIIDSGSWNTCHNQTGMKNCGFAICSSLMMREIVCSFIIIFKHFDVNFWDKDRRQGCNVSQIQTKKTKFLTLAKKKPWSIINLVVILAFSPILSFEPCHQWIFFRKYPKYRPTFYWGFIGLNPLPLWKFQFTFMLSFWNFGLLEKILRLLVIRISMLHYCKGLTIKIIRDGY